MTEKDKRDIAKIVSSQLKQHHTCPHGIDADTAASLKEFGQTWKIGKKTVLTTFFAGIAAGLGGLIILGIIAKVKSWF